MSKNTFIPTTKGLVSAHKSQDFTSDEKTQARTNIAAAASTHTHSADDIVSGALAKAQQHAQTAYLDATSQVFAGAATFNGLLQINGAAGGASTYLQLLNNSGAIGILGSDASISGGNAADVGLSVYGDNEFCLWANSTRMIRVNDSGSTFYNAATFNGVLYADSVGTNIRLKADGGSLDGALVADGAGNLFLGDFNSLTRGWRINPDGTMATLGSGATTFNGNISAASGLAVSGKIQISNSGSGFGSALTNGNSQFYSSSTLGLVIAGAGSTSDLTVTNKSGGDVFSIPTGTTNVDFAGAATFNGTVSATGFGVGAAVDANLPFRSLASSNATVGMLLNNTSSGSSASSAVIVESDAGQAGFRQYSLAHSVWPGTTVISSPSGGNGLAIVTSGASNPIEFHTNDMLRASIGDSGATFNGQISAASGLAVSGKIQISNNGSGFGSTLSNGSSQFYNSTTAGLIIAGAGSTSDLLVTNKSGGSVFSIPTGTVNVDFAGTATFASAAKLGDYTVATLPSAASNAGYEANVTDSSVTTFGSTVAGSGSSRVKVYSNGTNWTVQAA